MRKAPIKPLQQAPRAPAAAGCDGHQTALLTPDPLQGPGRILSAHVLTAQGHISHSKASPFPSPARQDVALNSNRLMGAGFGEAVVPVNLRRKNKSLVKS